MVEITQPPHQVSIDYVIENYGILREKILEAHQHYPELIELRGGEQLVNVNRLGATKTLTHKEILQLSLKGTDGLLGMMQSWFYANNLELSPNVSEEVMVAQLRRYLKECLRLTHIDPEHPFTGQQLYDNRLFYSGNGKPNGRYLKTDVKREIQSNLGSVGDVIASYADYDVTSMSNKQLLIEYRATNSLTIRDELIQRYKQFVKKIAEYTCYKSRRVNKHLELGDLIGAGTLGLIDTIDGYDPTQGIKFKDYAYLRVKGEIGSALKEGGIVPYEIFANYRRIDEAMSYLKHLLGRKPTEIEIMEMVKVDKEKFKEMLFDYKTVKLIFNSRRNIPENSREEVEPEDYREEPPHARITRKDMIETIEKGLSRTEKLILMLYNGIELNMREIADVIDISEGRVCQLLSSDIMPKLKEILEQHPQCKEDWLTDKDAVR